MRSCQEIYDKDERNTGFLGKNRYIIDVDQAGPLRPFQVRCEFDKTTDNAVTLVRTACALSVSQGLRKHDITHDINDITHGINNITHDINDITHGINDITHDINDISQYVNDITHYVNDTTHDINDIIHYINDKRNNVSLNSDTAFQKTQLIDIVPTSRPLAYSYKIATCIRPKLFIICAIRVI